MSNQSEPTNSFLSGMVRKAMNKAMNSVSLANIALDWDEERNSISKLIVVDKGTAQRVGFIEFIDLLVSRACDAHIQFPNGQENNQLIIKVLGDSDRKELVELYDKLTSPHENYKFMCLIITSTRECKIVDFRAFLALSAVPWPKPNDGRSFWTEPFK